MNFNAWRTVLWGCVALTCAVVVAVRRTNAPGRTRAVGSAGLVFVATSFFVLARSYVLLGLGRWYTPAWNAALSLGRISMAVGLIGVTLLCWWIPRSLHLEKLTPQTILLLRYSLVIIPVSFSGAFGCSIAYHYSPIFKLAGLCCGMVGLISAIICIVIAAKASKSNCK